MKRRCIRFRHLGLGALKSVILSTIFAIPQAWARLNVPELPVLEGVDPAQGPFGVLEGIVVYCIYLVASLSIVWILLSVGRRVTAEFNEARRESGDFGRVIITAFVGVAISLFVIFLANYLIDIIQ